MNADPKPLHPLISAKRVQGQNLAEYGILIGLVVVVSVASLSNLGSIVQDSMTAGFSVGDSRSQSSFLSNTNGGLEGGSTSISNGSGNTDGATMETNPGGTNSGVNDTRFRDPTLPSPNTSVASGMSGGSGLGSSGSAPKPPKQDPIVTPPPPTLGVSLSQTPSYTEPITSGGGSAVMGGTAAGGSSAYGTQPQIPKLPETTDLQTPSVTHGGLGFQSVKH